MRDYVVREMTSGFIVEEGADITMAIDPRRHAFTTLQEVLEYLGAELDPPEDTH